MSEEKNLDKKLLKTTSIETSVNMDLEMLQQLLANQLTPEEAFEFIKGLDLAVADWDLTEKLVCHFNSEVMNLVKGENR